MISFTANLINKINVKKLNNNQYQNQKVSFVELDVDCENDKKFLENLSEEWLYQDLFVKCIEDNFLTMTEDYDEENNSRFFVLTSQDDGFERLDVKKALGIAQTSPHDTDDINIDYLQTNPKYIKKQSTKPTEIKNIGCAIITSLKHLFKDKSLKLQTTSDLIEFYKKNGFLISKIRGGSGVNMSYDNKKNHSNMFCEVI